MTDKGPVNAFEGLTLDELQCLRAKYLDAVGALATAASYSLVVATKNGASSQQSLTRSDLPSIKKTLGEILAEIRRQTDNVTSRTSYADFRYISQ